MNTGIFSPVDIRCKRPSGGVPCGSTVEFFIRPGLESGVSAARMVIISDSEEKHIIPMELSEITEQKQVFHCGYIPPESGLRWYRFEIDMPGRTAFVCPSTALEGEIRNIPDGNWQLTVYSSDYRTPDWIKGGLIYQIFPDRFCREGGLPDDMPGRILRNDWGGTPDYQPDETGRIPYNDYFGGNLKGIQSKLPYLESLGITAIYLNPIFEASSNHRYNTADYFNIDPLLGNEEDFKSLCSEAEKLGIGIILDGVFNHTGDDSIYFNKYGRYPGTGAYQSRDSEFFSWYDFQIWPGKYSCWWNIPTLPAVNDNDPGYLEFVTGNGGVLKHWLQAGAAGFRLDVADELTTPFIENIRSSVKAQNPEALLLGEVWEDASNKVSYGERRHYLEGRELDGIMNYPFRNATIDFLCGSNAKRFSETVLSIIDHYPKQSIDASMNILSTHDTVRIITALTDTGSGGLKSSQWKADQRLTVAEKRHGIGLVKLAAAIQFFLPGVPCIYYGDEAGLEGYEDPHNRRCFPWGNEEQDLVGWYQRLGKIRKACPALAHGGYESLTADGAFLAFLRMEGDDMIICAVNTGSKPYQLGLPGDCGFYKIAGMPEQPENHAETNVKQFETTVKQGGNIVKQEKNAADIPAYGCGIFGSGKWMASIYSQ